MPLLSFTGSFTVLQPDEVTDGNAAGQLVRLARTSLPYILEYPASLGEDGVAVLARVRLASDNTTMQYLLGVVDSSGLQRFYATRRGPVISATWRVVVNGTVEQNVTWTFNTGYIMAKNESYVYLSFGIQFERAVLIWHTGSCPEAPTTVFGDMSDTELLENGQMDWMHYQVRAHAKFQILKRTLHRVGFPVWLYQHALSSLSYAL